MHIHINTQTCTHMSTQILHLCTSHSYPILFIQLDSILNLLGGFLPGVSSAYLYIGTWRAMFAYHVEDLDLYSINYLHSGAAKSWYSIKQKDRKRFEALAESYFGEEREQCNEFLRHKTKIFSPQKLKDHAIECTTVLHEAGEFIVSIFLFIFICFLLFCLSCCVLFKVITVALVVLCF